VVETIVGQSRRRLVVCLSGLFNRAFHGLSVRFSGRLDTRGVGRTSLNVVESSYPGGVFCELGLSPYAIVCMVYEGVPLCLCLCGRSRADLFASLPSRNII
jgi:hypothetical protein